MKKHLIALAAFLMCCAPACKKYDEGPALSLRSKKSRIANKWKVDKLFKNGVDSSMFYTAEGTWLETDKDGNASAMVIRSNGYASDTSNSEGRWELLEENRAFALILTDLQTKEVDTSAWWIVRLKEKEFWLQENDNDSDGNPDEELRLLPF